MVATAFGVGQLALVAVGRLDATPWLAYATMPGLAAAAMVGMATRRLRSAVDAVVAVLFWAPALIALATIAILSCTTAFRNHQLTLFELGVLFVVIFLAQPLAPLGAAAAARRQWPSHEAPVRAMLGAALGLFAVESLLWCLAGGSARLLLPGAATALFAAAWIKLRRRFVRRVAAGLEPGFVVLASEGGAIESGLIPYQPLRRRCVLDTLAATTPSASAGRAYREAERPIPLYLLCRD
jgi:hypothetical protein